MEIVSEISPLEQDIGHACVVIDRHALIQSLGKPHDCKTFGDYASVFYRSVTKHFSDSTKRIDVLFDRYIQDSIKANTRRKRMGDKRPIRRIIDRLDVPLPANWEQFLALGANKADMANFLSEHMLSNCHALERERKRWSRWITKPC